MRLRHAILLLVPCFVAWRTSAPVREDAMSAQDVLAQIIAADNAGDVERVMACYSPTPMLMPPNEGVVEGREAVRARYAMAFENYRFEFTGVERETHASGNVAWMRGETRGRLVSKTGGEDVAAHDKFLMTLERDGAGHWHIARLMWSPAEAR